MPSSVPTITFIGGGPRSAGILERLTANKPGLFDGPLAIHIVEPHEPGSGRIWRYDQSPGLLLNSTAADVTMFTDGSVACAGPPVKGPGLAAWAAGVLDGSIRDVPPLEPHILEQLRTLTPASFPSRQLQGKYLEWFFRHAVAGLGPDAEVTVHRDTATAVEHSQLPDGGARYSVRLSSGTMLEAGLVVYSLGHTDSQTEPESARLADFAARHGGFHAAPSYTADVGYSAIAPGQDVLVSGMGLAFVDLLVLLFEGRGGHFENRPDGGLDYVPSGAEPRLWAGSRRGVPYHSKISSTLRGEPVGALRYFTAAAVESLLEAHEELDFRAQLWPLVAKDAGYAYYRELFTGYPERVRGGWDEFSARFDALDWYSREREDLVAAAIPDPALRLDLEALDQPFSGCAFADHAAVQRSVVSYIERDLNLRTSPDHSETLALFSALLRVYMELGRLVPQERLNSRSQQAVHGWWHGFFSFVDSGPPPHRLHETLALHRVGLLQFLGPGMWVRPDEASGRFVAGSFQSPVVVDAPAYIEARLPPPSVARSANPALADLHDAGWGTEQLLLTSDGPHSTGKLLVSSSHEVLAPDGGRQVGLFAVGPWTSGWGAGAFARPGTNAAPFRENDALARRLLTELAAPSAAHPGTGHPTSSHLLSL
ncbi:FAD/NAD(P)-binding protein [Arthrobacter methylotrophus]|uniref:FAD/NAD(P)-binding protein n=1 Tax=Arthrobacter methylotrophus TaxID=121291 RepID=A0ABV5UWA3_9MICC